jgi:hypothetical protein
MRRILIGLIVLLIPNVVLAQQVVWNQSGVSTPTQAQGFTYRLYVTPAGSSTTSAPVTLTSVLCGGTVPNVQCATVLPTAASAANITGAKSELTTAESTSGVESSKSTPFIKPADVPTNLRITP